AALQGFKVLDIVDPTSPALIDSFSSPTWIMSGIAVEGDWVYATKYTAPPNFCHALHVIDASDKTDPQYVNGVPSAGRSNGVCTTADEVLVGGVLSGVYIYDRSSPAAPIQVGWIDTLAINIAVEDDIVFTTMLNNGLLAYDFSTPSSPVFVSSAPEYINVNGVLADGDYVYTMEMNVDSIGYYGCPFYLRVLDFSDLQNPQAVGFCPLGLAQPFYYSFAKYSHYLYLPRGDSGVAIADVSDPTQPTLVGSYLPLAGRCSNITVAGGYLYLSIVEGALEVLSLANPTAPFLVDFDVYPSSVEFTCVQDDYLYVNATTAVYLYHLNYPPVECGDLNGDGLGNVTDVVYLINFIFSDGPPPAADGVGDVDCDGITNITDAVYLIAYIFSAGAAPCADCP
ncbi:MAG: dockerin type I domain-containing protein, partial [bacterium]